MLWLRLAKATVLELVTRLRGWRVSYEYVNGYTIRSSTQSHLTATAPDCFNTSNWNKNCDVK